MKHYLLCLIFVVATPLAVIGEVRTWTDRKGNQVEAELTGVDGMFVILELKNGNTLRVPLLQFRKSDRDFIQKLGTKAETSPEKAASQKNVKKQSAPDALHWLNLVTETALELRGHHQHQLIANYAGDLYVRANDVGGAYRIAEQIDDLPRRISVFRHIAEAQLKIGDDQGAVKTAEKMLELVPLMRGKNNPGSIYITLAESGAIDQAVEHELKSAKKAKYRKMTPHQLQRFTAERRDFAIRLRVIQCANNGRIRDGEEAVKLFEPHATANHGLHSRLMLGLIKLGKYERAVEALKTNDTRNIVRVMHVCQALADDRQADPQLKQARQLFAESDDSQIGTDTDRIMVSFVRGYLDRGMIDEAWEITVNDLNDRTQAFKWVLIEEVRRGGPKHTKLNFAQIVKSMDEKERLRLAQAYIEAGRYDDAQSVPRLGGQFTGRIEAMLALHQATNGDTNYQAHVNNALKSQETRGRQFTKTILLIDAHLAAGNQKDARMLLEQLAAITAENAITSIESEVHQLTTVALKLGAGAELQNWISRRNAPHVRAYSFAHAADAALASAPVAK